MTTTRTARPATTLHLGTAYVGRGVKVHMTWEQVTADGKSYGLNTFCGAEGRGPRQAHVRRLTSATADCGRCAAEQAKRAAR